MGGDTRYLRACGFTIYCLFNIEGEIIHFDADTVKPTRNWPRAALPQHISISKFSRWPLMIVAVPSTKIVSDLYLIWLFFRDIGLASPASVQ